MDRIQPVSSYEGLKLEIAVQYSLEERQSKHMYEVLSHLPRPGKVAVLELVGPVSVPKSGSHS